LKDRILNEFHNSPISGHMGVDKTFHRLQANSFWQGMRQDIRKYIAQCSVCQETRGFASTFTGTLRNLGGFVS
jgi:hypothetical protein